MENLSGGPWENLQADLGRTMTATEYRGRRAATIENADLRVTVLQEGGHIAEIFDKAAGVNPLWTPPWPSIEPSEYGPGYADMYGSGSDARLLAGIMGHNLCLDIFGPPTDEEAKAGLTAHGEGSVAPYELTASGDALVARAQFPIAGLEFERRIVLRDRVVLFHETLKNVTSTDRAIGWTQHVTLGPPFLERGATQFRASATRSKVFEADLRRGRLLEAGGGVRMADGARARWRRRRPSRVFRCETIERVHRPSHGPAADVSRSSSRSRRHSSSTFALRLERVGFSVDGHLGRKPQPDRSRRGTAAR